MVYFKANTRKWTIKKMASLFASVTFRFVKKYFHEERLQHFVIALFLPVFTKEVDGKIVFFGRNLV